MKIDKLFLMAVMGMLLAGCQSGPQSDSPKEVNQNSANNLNSEKPVVDRGAPYSNGPTSSPDVKGPTAAPPEDGATTPYGKPPAAQAVTTNENIRLTLPLKNQQ